MFNSLIATLSQHTSEPSLELLGGLFKSKEERQKARVEKAVSKIDDIVKTYETRLARDVVSTKKSLDFYTVAMKEIAQSIKGKRLDTAAFNNCRLDESMFYFSCLKKNVDALEGDRTRVEKILTGIDTDTALKAYVPFFWFGGDHDGGDGDLVDPNEIVMAPAAGYRPDFVPYAISTVSVFRKAATTMISLTSRGGEFFERQKTKIAATNDPKEIHEIVEVSWRVKVTLLGALSAAADDDTLHVFVGMAKFFVKNCYK